MHVISDIYLWQFFPRYLFCIFSLIGQKQNARKKKKIPWVAGGRCSSTANIMCLRYFWYRWKSGSLRSRVYSPHSSCVVYHLTLMRLHKVSSQPKYIRLYISRM